MSSEPPRSVWFVLLAPPVAWFTALSAGYFMVAWACGSAAGRAALHGSVLAMLAVGVAAAVVGLRAWRRHGEAWPGEGPEPTTRTRFLSVVGTLGAMLFSLAILIFWVATLSLSPCEPGPRTPFAPSASAEAKAERAGGGAA